MTTGKKRDEIRIVNPPAKLFKTISDAAKKNKRSHGKQAEWMLERYLEQTKDQL